MAKKKRRVKKKRNKGSRSKPKRPLSMQEMLDRIPDKEYLTTPDVQHVFNDCHKVTVWKMTSGGDLIRYRTRSRGKANVYKREDVVRAVKARFQLRLAPSSDQIRETQGINAEEDQDHHSDGSRFHPVPSPERVGDHLRQ